MKIHRFAIDIFLRNIKSNFKFQIKKTLAVLLDQGFYEYPADDVDVTVFGTANVIGRKMRDGKSSSLWEILYCIIDQVVDTLLF